MKPINFKQDASQRIYADYIKRIKRVTSKLSKSDREEVLMEFNSHIYEAMNRDTDLESREVDQLLNILEKLGAPEDVLTPLVAEKSLEKATKTFNPVHVFKALALNISNGVLYTIVTLLYLSLFGFVFLIYAKITNPSDVGLFLKNGRFMALGKISPDYLQGSAIVEVLGYWFIPAMILAIGILYILITLLLRLKRQAKRKH